MITKTPKYVKQIKSITNGTQYFYAEAEFLSKTEEKVTKSSVLDLLSESKIGLFIFDSSKKESVKYNIEAESAFYILEKTKLCMQKQLASKKKDEKISPAYTVRFRAGMLAGKTPAELLLENPANRQALINQFNFLSTQNNPKYAAMNKSQMEAISEAIKLFDSGTLKADMVGESGIEIYKGG